jgi:hypothetical protein
LLARAITKLHATRQLAQLLATFVPKSVKVN